MNAGRVCAYLINYDNSSNPTPTPNTTFLDTPQPTSQTPTIIRRPVWTWSEIVGASKYRIELDGVFVKETILSSFVPSFDLNDGIHTIRVKAIGDTNESDWGEHTVLIQMCDLPDGHTTVDASLEDAIDGEGTITDIGTIFALEGDTKFAFNIEEYPINSADPITTYVRTKGNLVAVIYLDLLPNEEVEPLIYYRCNSDSNESCNDLCYKGNIVKVAGSDYEIILTEA